MRIKMFYKVVFSIIWVCLSSADGWAIDDKTALYQIASSGLNLKNKSYEELLQTEIPASLASPVSINGRPLPRPHTFSDYITTLKKIHQAIEKSRSKTISLSFDHHNYVLDLPALGRGARGIVYSLHNKKQVIKLPHADFMSMWRLMDESVMSAFWETSSKRKNFSVPKTKFNHPLGLYSIKQKNTGETLSQYFLRHGLMRVGRDGKSVELNPELPNLKTDPNLLKVWRGISQMLDIVRESPAHGVSFSPNNIHITYKDASMTKIRDVALVDVGRCQAAGKKYIKVTTPSEYLNKSTERMENYIAKKRTMLRTMTFAETQKCKNFISLPTVAGNKVRVCGLDKKTFRWLKRELYDYFKSLGFKPYSMIIHGSRVMPRAELVKRNPSLCKKIPVFDDGVYKDRVRIAGITNLSDLDIYVTLPETPVLETNQRLAIQKKLRNNIDNKFRRFPIGVGVIQLPKAASPQAELSSVERIANSRKAKIMPAMGCIRVPFRQGNRFNWCKNAMVNFVRRFKINRRR